MTQEENQNNGEKYLLQIRGAKLSSVQFVLNYLILGFEERGALTTLVWPEVTHEAVTLKFGTPGYRDCLCDFISREIQNVDVRTDETIVITFAGGSNFKIPLRTHVGPGERAIFSAPNHVLFVW